MFLLFVMILGLLVSVGLLTYALFKALHISKEPSDSKQKAIALTREFPRLFPWPVQ